MTRAVLSMMAGLLCAFAGLKYAASLKADAIRLHRWVQLLRHLSLLIREGTLPLPEALCAVAEGNALPDAQLRNMAGQMNNSPLLTLKEAYQCVSPSGEEKETLFRMFSRLGRGTKENRALAVEQASEELALLSRNASDKAEKDAKLWQTLGVTGGICLTILLL